MDLRGRSDSGDIGMVHSQSFVDRVGSVRFNFFLILTHSHQFQISNSYLHVQSTSSLTHFIMHTLNPFMMYTPLTYALEKTQALSIKSMPSNSSMPRVQSNTSLGSVPEPIHKVDSLTFLANAVLDAGEDNGNGKRMVKSSSGTGLS